MISLLLLTLPLGATLIWVIPGARNARWIALITALVTLFIASIILYRFDASQTNFQMLEHADWIPALNIHYTVGIDGISILFLPLTSLLFLGVILASWTRINSMPRLYFTLLLILESLILGIFCALDTLLFFLLWELTLVPLYFLISLWGVGPNRRYAAVKYTLTMLVGGIPLLFAFLLLAFNHADVNALPISDGLSFDYQQLLATPLSSNWQVPLFFLLLAGFATKIPLIPFHTWLPIVAMEGPTMIAATIVGLKLGIYGLLRFVIPLAPHAAVEFHWVLAGIGITGVLYGAMMAIAQTNLRKILAYSSISHVGLVVLGIASFDIQGLQGALYLTLNFTVVASGLFLLTGFLHHRIGSTDIVSLGGVAKQMPLLTTFFFLFGLASLGIPGTSGFPGEFLILLSTVHHHTGAGLAALVSIVLAAVYFISSFQRAFLGPVTNVVIAESSDLNMRELLTVCIFGIIMLFLGLYPAALLNLTEATSQNWLQHLSI